MTQTREPHKYEEEWRRPIRKRRWSRTRRSRTRRSRRKWAVTGGEKLKRG